LVTALAGTAGGAGTGAGAARVEAALRGGLATADAAGAAASRVCSGAGAGALHAANAIRIELAAALRRILMSCRGSLQRRTDAAHSGGTTAIPRAIPGRLNRQGAKVAEGFWVSTHRRSAAAGRLSESIIAHPPDRSAPQGVVPPTPNAAKGSPQKILAALAPWRFKILEP